LKVTVQNTCTKENNRIQCTTIQELIHFLYNKEQYLTHKCQPSVIISTKKCNEEDKSKIYTKTVPFTKTWASYAHTARLEGQSD